MKKIILFITSIVMCFAFVGCGSSEGTQIKVDFSLRDGSVVQNLKKIDQFSPTWAFHTDRSPGFLDKAGLDTVKGLNEFQADNFRVDLMMGNGGMGHTLGAYGGDGSSKDEWSLVMQFIDVLKENNLTPYLNMIGVPEYAAKEGVYGYAPDLEKYYEFCFNAASYLARNDVYAILETWNEPDYLNSYWYDSMYDFVKTSVTATKAYKDAYPLSTVAATGLAYPVEFIQQKTREEDGQKSNWQRMWELSEQNNAMPDAFSWHFYGWGDGDLEGGNDITKRWSYKTDIVRDAIMSYQNGTAPELNGKSYDLSKLQQHLTEFNPISNDAWQSSRQVWAFFDSIKALNAATDITRATWSQYVGDDYALLKSDTYEVMPSYHVLWMYGRLPVDLVPVTSDNDRIGMMAGADSKRAGFIVYNKSDVKRQAAKITFKNLPEGTVDCDVYIINQNDYDTGVYSKTPVKFKHINKVKNGFKLDLDIPETGAYYVEFSGADGKSEQDEYKNIGKILKKEYYYPDRADNLPYADIFNNNLNAYAGMCGHDKGESGAAIMLGDLFNQKELIFSYDVLGTPVKTEQTVLGARIDYHTGAGFSNSVLLSVKDYNYNGFYPFGTEKSAELVLSMGEGLQGDFTFNLKKYAPKDWDGTVELSYLIKDAGAGTAAKFRIS